jgi:uncharacterized 2Fe-2S/4Fe-4S cluster protein (DUF4445 family)
MAGFLGQQADVMRQAYAKAIDWTTSFYGPPPFALVFFRETGILPFKMKDRVRVELRPLGKIVEAQIGTSMREVLFPLGVEFPCGGKGRCRGCKVKVLQGDLPATAEQTQMLSKEEIAAGWRLACKCVADADLTLELAQWEASILADDTLFDFQPRDGFGVAVDLGTTTLAAQLLDMRTGAVLAVNTALNSQARHGADIMSRIQHAIAHDGLNPLTGLIREQIGTMIREMLNTVNGVELRDVAIVGNTVMHHLFCGIDPKPLSHYPFEPVQDGLQLFSPAELGWNFGSEATVRFLPCLGSFVGSDILAGILAVRMHETEPLCLLIDLGTNGEIVLGNRHRMLCTSTAAGPAFEGARISMGMRAATGAISEVWANGASLSCRVLGGGAPRGICGSGLVDAVAVALNLGNIMGSGRLADKKQDLTILAPVKITQADVRELQLAKGAIAAGIRILIEQWGATDKDVAHVYLAGAFGNYINRENARRIGLYGFGSDRIKPAGNTALLGAKLALFAPWDANGKPEDYAAIRSIVRHVSLSADPHFQDIYMEEMSFPEA